MIPPAHPFPRHRHLNLLFQYCLELSDETDMRHTLLHHDCNGFCPPLAALVHGILEHLHRDAIPPDTLAIRTNLFLQGEVAIEFQVECVELSDFRVRSLIDDLAGYM